MRVFVAIDLSGEVRRNIAALQAELAPSARDAHWVRPDSMHITLKFIGHVAADRVEQIKSSLAPIRSGSPVALRFRGAGCFPNTRRPRALWVGIESSPNLAELADNIASRLEPLGITREEREFHPHLTVARFKEPLAQISLQKILGDLASREFGEISTSDFHLFESQLKREGAEYARLATFRFVSCKNPSP